MYMWYLLKHDIEWCIFMGFEYILFQFILKNFWKVRVYKSRRYCSTFNSWSVFFSLLISYFLLQLKDREGEETASQRCWSHQTSCIWARGKNQLCFICFYGSSLSTSHLHMGHLSWQFISIRSILHWGKSA